MANTRVSYSTSRLLHATEPLGERNRQELLESYYNRGALKANVHRSTGSELTSFSSEANEAEIIDFPKYTTLLYSPSESMWALQEWDGYVSAIDDVKFFGILSVKGGEFIETERLEYELVLLTKFDQQNITVGSIFRLSVGYSRKATGQVRQQIAVYFRPRLSTSKPGAEKSEKAIRRLLSKAVKINPKT